MTPQRLDVHNLQNMTKDDLTKLQNDPDGLKSYEILANNLDSLTTEDLDQIVDNIARVDTAGQYLTSGARFLNAIDSETYAPQIRRMVALVIDRDREHRFIPDLIEALYGPDYVENAAQLAANDNNFRRMFKRLYPEGVI